MRTKMIWTIPNMLTYGRVLAAPLLPVAYLVFERPIADWVALVLFGLASITDYFDGWLARKWDQVSEIGKMLDPIADKAMVLIALAMLLAMAPTGESPLGWDVRAWLIIPTSLIILREVLVSGLREYLGDIKLSVTNLAKWKTTLQMLAIGTIFLSYAVLFIFVWRYHAEHGGLPWGETPFDDRTALAALWLAKVILFPLGLGLFWIAALLTAVTGWDYFSKGLAHIRERGGM